LKIKEFELKPIQTFEDWTDMISRSVSNCQSTLRNIPKERRPQGWSSTWLFFT